MQNHLSVSKRKYLEKEIICTSVSTQPSTYLECSIQIISFQKEKNMTYVWWVSEGMFVLKIAFDNILANTCS